MPSVDILMRLDVLLPLDYARRRGSASGIGKASPPWLLLLFACGGLYGCVVAF